MGNRHPRELLGFKLIRKTSFTVQSNKESKGGLGKTFQIYDIVDGQQRFTSLIILLNSIANEMEDLKSETSHEIGDTIKKTYIKEKSIEGPSIYKLELDDDNNSYFRDAIIENKKGIEQRIESHKRLADAKKQFTSY